MDPAISAEDDTIAVAAAYISTFAIILSSLFYLSFNLWDDDCCPISERQVFVATCLREKAARKLPQTALARIAMCFIGALSGILGSDARGIAPNDGRGMRSVVQRRCDTQCAPISEIAFDCGIKDAAHFG